jgi:hypothetical protein
MKAPVKGEKQRRGQTLKNKAAAIAAQGSGRKNFRGVSG